ncbi:MAG: histidine kinase [Bacteroidota bacterium]
MAPQVTDRSRSQSVKTILKAVGFGAIGTCLIFLPWLGVESVVGFLRVIVYNVFVWLILWLGNGILSNYFSSRYSWIHQPGKTFVLVSLSVVSYTVLAMTIFICIWSFLVYDVPIGKTLSEIEVNTFTTFIVITLFVALFMHGRSFLSELRTSMLEAEKFKREVISSQFETLKNQVNPHFLFNSLNVLSTLVHKDPNLADKFIKQLSDVYRYVLDVKEREVVPLREELKALEAYVFLCKIRFSDNLQVDIDLGEDDNSMIPPLTLQMLVENAIKHNIVSNARPLRITIKREGERYLLVQNNLQKKSSMEEGTGLGLPNIRQRYRFLADEEVIISEVAGFFSVKIPVLKMNYQ